MYVCMYMYNIGREIIFTRVLTFNASKKKKKKRKNGTTETGGENDFSSRFVI